MVVSVGLNGRQGMERSKKKDLVSDEEKDRKGVV